MNGIERIKNVFSSKKTIAMMSHVVGGYPDIDRSESIIYMMAGKGVDLIEVQLPFSDPIADGSVIVQANHHALRAGITTEIVLQMLERVRMKIDIPLLIMSYVNPLFAFGIEAIIDRAVSIGVDGFIVPDYPLDEPELDVVGLCNRNRLAFVPLIAPTTGRERVALITNRTNSPFVYAVLRLGVTGRKTELDTKTIEYLRMIHDVSGRYVAAGFGIREKAQFDALRGVADCGIIGSELLRCIQGAIAEGIEPAEAVGVFLDLFGEEV